MSFKEELARALRTLPDRSAVQAALTALDSGQVDGAGQPASVSGLDAEAQGTAGQKTVFTFTDMDVALVDEAGVVAYGGQQIFNFPEGLIRLDGAVLDVDLTKSSAGVNDDWDGDIGVGTVTASNNATLATTEQNVLPTTATPQAVAGATTGDILATASEIGVVIDGTSTAASAWT